MSTRDDEIEDEIVREESEEEIERHTKPHDSYRELPTTDDVKDMTQPPLEPQIEELEEELKSTVQALKDNTVSVESALTSAVKTEGVYANEPIQEEVVATPVDESIKAETPTVSQEDIQPVAIIQPQTVDVYLPSQESKSDTPESIPQTEEIQSQVAQPEGKQAVYHTVSGGPETIHDKFVGSNASAPLSTSATPQYTAAQAASGYSIPNPNYVQPVPMDLQTQSNFGSVFFLVLLSVVGGGISYVYFYMPQTFDQVFDAIIIVKNQILKQ